MALVSTEFMAERIVGYLGPRGTHSEEVALCLYRGEKGRFIPFASIDAAIRAVETGEVMECLVPVENSLEGSVNITLDTLAHDVNLFITREMVWPVKHNLLVKAGTKHINVVVSHPQALAQCRHYLARFYPGVELKPVESTAEAAYLVASGAKNHAAIASLRAGEIYGLETVAADIQDNPNNYTRFIVLAQRPADVRSGRRKTSVVCQINGERPGSLCDVLQEFARRNVNLTKIESRPARTGLGVYIFFLDIDGDIDDDNVHAAVSAVKLKSLWFKNLGSYPVYAV
ncbi:Prephenate dehydratase [Thermosinus carboxydivorans Nor1]|uniref:Prephenate dehydratase n=1 Tax=Thermosinus carboxydivorans Nor1 TaxID=401526 RepID=A1HS62_9FIRM|nr:prephenate dehydratase [Thermosinus carboxydivorans]EAX47127.1 Prephenate dehydratase [Thermosinus carboxydivorans Nor1]